MKMIVDISEEDINKIKNIRFLIGGKEDRLLQYSIINAIKNSTPVVLTDISEKEKGEWIKKGFSSEFHSEIYQCSKCNYELFSLGAPLNFCPNCGTDMRGHK